MPNIKDIADIIEQEGSLKLITESYSEIASVKLKRIRSGIEKNRNFLSEIAGIYYTIRLVARERSILASSHKPFLRFLDNPKTTHSEEKSESRKPMISVLLTSNHRFYGNLENILMHFFIENVGKFKTDILVVGKIGADFFKTKRERPNALIFKNDLPTRPELEILLKNINEYERILVYHTKLQSVLSQAPYITNVRETQVEANMPKKRIDYIFEPEIDKMLTFFNTQISILILEQTFLEAELARTAARLITMDHATQNATEAIKKYQKTLAGAKASLANIRFLEIINDSKFAKRNSL